MARTAPPYRLGFHRLAAIMLVMQAAVLAFDVLAFTATGLHYSWSTWRPEMVVLAAFVAFWLYYVRYPGRRPADWITAETLLCVVLWMSIGSLVGPGQYAAIALKRPLIDSWLAGFDRALGIDVGALAAWTNAHPFVRRVLLDAYLTIGAQYVMPILALGLLHRDRERMWEYLWNFHVCAAVTLACLAIWPAAGAFEFGQFTSSFNQARFIQQFHGIYSGAWSSIDATQLDGLVSFPSFHAAGALMTTWAMRRYRWWLLLLVPVNALLIAATVLSGAHYVTDLMGTAAMCGGSLWLWRMAGQRWLAHDRAVPPFRQARGEALAVTR